jgi:transposase
MPVHNVSDLTGVSVHKIGRALDTYIELAKMDEDYSAISIVGMDETSIAKGHEYITLFVDLEERKTVHISAGKDHISLRLAMLNFSFVIFCFAVKLDSFFKKI